MKFYDRERELALLGRLSGTPSLKFVVVKGLRRIGKTSLVLRYLEGKDYAYVFVPKGKTVPLFLETACSELGIPSFARFGDFLKYLLEKHEFVFFDEFQNFYFMDASIYSDVQRILDEKRDMKGCVIVTGSSHSLMKKVFSDYTRALYGRRDAEIALGELPLGSVFRMMEDMGIRNFADKVMFWSIFGGMPRFYGTLEKLGVHSFSEFEKEIIGGQARMLFEEGRAILVSEFGGDYKIFHSAMEAISSGKTTLSEIASVFGSDPVAANRYVTKMREDYNLIEKHTPAAENEKSRRTRYGIRNNFLRFWFRYLKRNESLIEQGLTNRLSEMIMEDLNSFIGRSFERMCLSLLAEGEIDLPFRIDMIGGQWGKFRGEGGRDEYEIDIMALDGKGGNALFAECKWKDGVDAKSVLSELRKKSGYVDWRAGKRKEHFAIFAKSFRGQRPKDAMLFDIKDIERLLSERGRSGQK